MASFSTNMPLSHEDQYRLASILPPTAACKVVGAAPARLYQATLNAPTVWTATGLRGVLIFGYDSTARSRSAAASAKRVYWLRIVDLRRGSVLWERGLPEVVEYHADKPFFHTLASTNCVYGFRFEEDEDAAVFLAQVTQRVVDMPAKRRPTPSRSSSSSSIPTSTHAADRSKTSPPLADSFIPGSHASPEAEAPEWDKLISRLEDYGVEAELVEENLEFVKGFLAGAEVVRETVVHSSSARSSASSSPKTAAHASPKGSVHFSPHVDHAPYVHSQGSSRASSLESLHEHRGYERGYSRDHYRHAGSKRPGMPPRGYSDHYRH